MPSRRQADGSAPDWDDLRLVLAVARAGSLAGAARALGIDHSTTFRRLRGIEARIGTTLFERLPAGAYMPTAAGERIAGAAERMESEALAVARDIAGRDHRLEGRLRVTSSETLAYRLLTPHIAAFRAAHPGIVVELTIDNRVLSLSRREADIALRALRPTEPELWGRKLADVAWTVYGARRYLAEAGLPRTAKDLAKHPIVGWEDGITGVNAADWLNATVPAGAVVFRTSSLVTQLVAVRAGIGLAALPCYLGDPEPGLARALRQPIAALAREIWIVTHADLKSTARVRAFFDVVGAGIAAERALIEGRSAAAHR